MLGLRSLSEPSTIASQSGSASSTLSLRGDMPLHWSAGKETNADLHKPHSTSSEDGAGIERPVSGLRRTRLKKLLEATQEYKQSDAVGADAEDANAAQEEDEEDGDDEEEVTRCICRRQEFPGLPMPMEDYRNQISAKPGSVPMIPDTADLPDDAGSLFIQCDICKVWQHGGCVGVMLEEMNPENYFCEVCRKDLHKVMTGQRGQRYSWYLPLYQGAAFRGTKRAVAAKDVDDGLLRETEGKMVNTGGTIGKRRSTMNSRAAEAEEEALRRVLEESKTEGAAVGLGDGYEGRKRARDGSEATMPLLKRRKTTLSSDCSHDRDISPIAAESDEEAQGAKGTDSGAGKKARSFATQARRGREARDREGEVQTERSEAAGRRQGRLQKRHADEPECAQKVPAMRATSRAPGMKSHKHHGWPKSPANTLGHATTSATHKRSAKPPARRGKAGKNQYTRERDPQPASKNVSPVASSNLGDSDGVGNRFGHSDDDQGKSNGSRSSKQRQLNFHRSSMNDVRKRAATILEYITRTQVEMAGESSLHSGGKRPWSFARYPRHKAQASDMDVAMNGRSTHRDVAVADAHPTGKGPGAGKMEATIFKQLSSLQMMDVLTRELVLWQKEHGTWGDKT